MTRFGFRFYPTCKIRIQSNSTKIKINFKILNLYISFLLNDLMSIFLQKKKILNLFLLNSNHLHLQRRKIRRVKITSISLVLTIYLPCRERPLLVAFRSWMLSGLKYTNFSSIYHFAFINLYNEDASTTCYSWKKHILTYLSLFPYY